MTIYKVNAYTGIKLLLAKKKRLNAEFEKRRIANASASQAQLPPKSGDFVALEEFARMDDSRIYLLSGFSGREDMEDVALHFFEDLTKNQAVCTILVNSGDVRRRLSSDLDTIEYMMGRSDSFHSIMLDDSDPDQSPLVIFGVYKKSIQQALSPDYMVRHLKKLQQEERVQRGPAAAYRNGSSGVF